MALVWCMALAATSYGKTVLRVHQKTMAIPTLTEVLDRQFKQFAGQGQTDQTIYCWFGDGFPVNWTVTFTGYNGLGTYTFTTDATTAASGVIGQVPPGAYSITLTCNDYPVPTMEIDYNSAGPYGSGTAYLYGSDDTCHMSLVYVEDYSTGINDLEFGR